MTHDDVRCAQGFGQRGGLDHCAVGVLGHGDAAAQLAVDLHHQLDFVLFEGFRIGLGEGRETRIVARLQLGIERLTDVRDDVMPNWFKP